MLVTGVTTNPAGGTQPGWTTGRICCSFLLAVVLSTSDGAETEGDSSRRHKSFCRQLPAAMARRWQAFCHGRPGVGTRLLSDETSLQDRQKIVSDYVAVYVRPDRPGHLKWATIKKELTAFNDAALRLGLQRPGLVTDNPWLRRLHYRAGRSTATRQQQHVGITVRVARGIFERHAGVGRLGRGRSVARAVALLLGYFFLLRPSELFGLTWSRVRFGRRRRDGSWKSTDATRAEIILLLVRHTKIARTIMHCRWPSGLAYFCPVRAMSFWWAWSWTAHLARSSPTTFGGRPLFPNAGGAPFAGSLRQNRDYAP